MDSCDVQIDAFIAIPMDIAPSDLDSGILESGRLNPLTLDPFVEIVTNLTVVDADLRNAMNPDSLATASGDDAICNQCANLFSLGRIAPQVDALGGGSTEATARDPGDAIFCKDAGFCDVIAGKTDSIDPIEQ